MRTQKNIAQMRDLASKHAASLKYPGDLEHDEATINTMGDMAFLFALSEEGTALFWFHQSPCPWGSLSKYLKSTRESLPGVRHFLIGLKLGPIEVPSGSSARDVLSHFRPSEDAR